MAATQSDAMPGTEIGRYRLTRVRVRPDRTRIRAQAVAGCAADRALRDPGVPNEEIELDCMVYVELGAKEVSARIVNTDDCDNPFVRAPRCPLVGVWKQAIADGAPESHVAKISWLFDEKWFVDTGNGYSGTIPDLCP